MDPEHVHSLVLLEPVFTFAWPSVSFFVWATVSSLPFAPTPLQEKALGKIGGTDFAAAQDDPTAQLIAAAAEHFTAALPIPQMLSRSDAARLTMPVYVAIAAQDSVAGGHKGAARAQRLLPHATVEIVVTQLVTQPT